MNGNINYLLENQPNAIMVTYDFIYKIISMLFISNNTFIYIDKNKLGNILGFYPISYTSSEFLADEQGNLYVSFWLINGKNYTLPYSDLIPLRRFYSKHDLLGSSNKALIEPVETQHTSNQGISNAIKTSNAVRGIIKYSQNLKEDDIKKNRDQFVKDFFDTEQNGEGIAALDNKGEFKEINLKPITLDKDQLEHVDQRVLNYFGLNKSILSSNFTSEQWNAFYESILEPLAIYLGQSFTSKIFKQKSIKDGHKIEFTVNRVQYASTDTKIKMVKEIAALGVLTIDQALEILDLPTIGGEEGSRRVQSLNYINALLADKYQLGGDNSGEGN